jgi:hypothetical protein
VGVGGAGTAVGVAVAAGTMDAATETVFRVPTVTSVFPQAVKPRRNPRAITQRLTLISYPFPQTPV